MIKKNFLNILLAGSILTTASFGSDQRDDLTTYLTGQIPHVQMAIPQENFGWEMWKNFKSTVGKFKDDTVANYGIAKDFVLKRDVGTVVAKLFEEKMLSTSEKFFKDYFHASPSRSDEFDVAALRPLFEKVQNTLYGAVDHLLSKKPLYVYHPSFGKLTVYEDKTVFRKLLEAIIPDVIPLKGAMVAVADIPVIRSYLVRKIDELTIEYLLKFYTKCTGKSVKQSVKSIMDHLVQRPSAEEPQQAKTQATAIDDNLEFKKSNKTAPSLDAEENEQLVQAEANEIEILESKEKEQATLMASSSLMSEEEISDIKAEKASAIWSYLEPRMNHLLRLSITECMLPAFDKAFEEFAIELQRKALPQSDTFGGIGKGALFGVAGAASLIGPGIQSLFGAPIGAMGYLAGTWGTQAFAKTVFDKVFAQKQLHVRYYLDSILPESEREHYLYGLNRNPTPEEKEIFSKDYYHQAIQREQGLIRAVLDDLSKLSYVAKVISQFSGEARMPSLNIAQDAIANSEYTAFLLGRIIEKQKDGKPLTESEKKLMENLQNYPSYAIKKEVSAIVKQWKEQGSAEFAKYTQTQKEQYRKAEQNLVKTYQLYAQDFPNAIAEVYQQLGLYSRKPRFELDFIEVAESVADAMATHLRTIDNKKLAVLKLAYQDYEFLAKFLKNFLDINVSVDADREEVKAALKIKEFLTQLMKDYVDHFRNKYKGANKSELEQVRKSVLGVGLSDIEIIELHCRMTEEDKQRYLVIDESKAKQAEVQELEVIREQVHALVGENNQKILRYYAEQLTRQLDMEEFVYWAAQGQEKEILKLKKKSQQINLEMPDYKDLPGDDSDQKKWAIVAAQWLNARLFTDLPLAENFRTQLRNFVPTSQLRGTVSTIITTNGFYRYMLQHPHALEIGEDKEFVMIKKGAHIDDHHDVPDNLATIPGGEKGEIQVEPYKGSLYALMSPDGQGILGKVDLVTIINTLYKEEKIKNILDISDDEMKLIQTQIHEFRKAQLYDAETLEFVEELAGLQAIMIQHAEKLQETKDLFYSYNDVYEQMMRDKTQVVERIMRQEIQIN